MKILAALVLLAALAATFAACSDDAATPTPTRTAHTSTPQSAVTTIVRRPTATPATAAATPGAPATITPDKPASPAPASTATLAPDRAFALAPIEDAVLVVRESAPPQYAVHITSGLPNGCAQFGDAVAARTAGAITVKVRNTVPADGRVICTQIYGLHEITVELGTDFVAGTDYTVRVNDRALMFTAQ